jgi:hypothetical protein
VHQDVRRAEAGDRGEHGVVGQASRHVVHQHRTGSHRRFRDFGTHGVDGHEDAVARQPLHDRHDAVQLLVRLRTDRSRPGGLTADVDQVGALCGQPESVLDGAVVVEVAATVGEGVGCDVDDAHHQAAWGPG